MSGIMARVSTQYKPLSLLPWIFYTVTEWGELEVGYLISLADTPRYLYLQKYAIPNMKYLASHSTLDSCALLCIGYSAAAVLISYI